MSENPLPVVLYYPMTKCITPARCTPDSYKYSIKCIITIATRSPPDSYRYSIKQLMYVLDSDMHSNLYTL